jgi:hypothetical protein
LRAKRGNLFAEYLELQADGLAYAEINKLLRFARNDGLPVFATAPPKT